MCRIQISISITIRTSILSKFPRDTSPVVFATLETEISRPRNSKIQHPVIFAILTFLSDLHFSKRCFAPLLFLKSIFLLEYKKHFKYSFFTVFIYEMYLIVFFLPTTYHNDTVENFD